MAPCRPTNLNKRAYPGNGSVIGPTRQTTCSASSTTCCSFFSTLCGSPTITWTLGCRNQPATCPCCHCCCCCTCTVCDRTIPSGMWKSSEQWEAKKRDAWGPDTCSNAAPIGFTANNGTISGSVDCYGFLITNTPSRWLVAPSSTQVQRTWYCRNDAVTTASAVGGSGWFIPLQNWLFSPGYTCRTYWDAVPGSLYWSDAANNATHAVTMNFPNASHRCYEKTIANIPVRAFRCV